MSLIEDYAKTRTEIEKAFEQVLEFVQNTTNAFSREIGEDQDKLKTLDELCPDTLTQLQNTMDHFVVLVKMTGELDELQKHVVDGTRRQGERK